VELDFQYASEGIHRRWDAGFRITACAATPDQVLPLPAFAAVAARQTVRLSPWNCFAGCLEAADALTQSNSVLTFEFCAPSQAAFVLSVPRRRPVDETQETLRTSAFPSTHVKDKWAKNLYIAGVAYGRTVS
jgi:hypothetical protein